jgi:hypothetical protein
MLLVSEAALPLVPEAAVLLVWSRKPQASPHLFGLREAAFLLVSEATLLLVSEAELALAGFGAYQKGAG